MQFWTPDAAVTWCAKRNIAIGPTGIPERDVSDFTSGRFDVPPTAGRLYWFAKVIERALRPWGTCLLWVTGWDIWASSENWHLYYRLRQTYLDHGLINSTPVHVAQGFEGVDLVSFVHLGLSFGWDMHFVTDEDRARVFVSHDEWASFSFRDEAELSALRLQHFSACTTSATAER